MKIKPYLLFLILFCIAAVLCIWAVSCGTVEPAPENQKPETPAAGETGDGTDTGEQTPETEENGGNLQEPETGTGRVSIKRLSGSLSRSGSVGNYVFTYNGASGSVAADHFEWYVNGIRQGSTSQIFRFTATDAGTYCITCIASYSEGLETDVISLRSYITIPR